MTTKLSDKQARFLATVPDSARGIVATAFHGECSPRRAIKAHCLSCAGFVRAEVRDCTVQLCALWTFRPYQTGGSTTEDSEPDAEPDTAE